MHLVPLNTAIELLQEHKRPYINKNKLYNFIYQNPHGDYPVYAEKIKHKLHVDIDELYEVFPRIPRRYKRKQQIKKELNLSKRDFNYIEEKLKPKQIYVDNQNVYYNIYTFKKAVKLVNYE